jgi:hypothetical protein
MSEAAATPPKGIGGWLIFVVIGLVGGPLRIAWTLYSNHFSLIQNGGWQVLTTPGTDAYHPLWEPLLVFEILANLGSIALAIATLGYLKRKSRQTPKLAIIWLAWTTTFVVIDFFVADLIPAVAAQNDVDSQKELVRSIVGACIWIPYFLVSKRVKATFVE